jgi:hypothetical protein
MLLKVVNDQANKFAQDQATASDSKLIEYLYNQVKTRNKDDKSKMNDFFKKLLGGLNEAHSADQHEVDLFCSMMDTGSSGNFHFSIPD